MSSLIRFHEKSTEEILLILIRISRIGNITGNPNMLIISELFSTWYDIADIKVRQFDILNDPKIRRDRKNVLEIIISPSRKEKIINVKEDIPAKNKKL